MASNEPNRTRTVPGSLERPTRVFSKQTSQDVDNNNSPLKKKGKPSFKQTKSCLCLLFRTMSTALYGRFDLEDCEEGVKINHTGIVNRVCLLLN